MKEFDYWRNPPYNMDTHGHALVVTEIPDYDWSKNNLIQTPVYQEDDFTGEMEYRRHEVSMRSCRIDDDRFLISYREKDNRQAVLDNFPDIVLEANPFGPDICLACQRSHAIPSQQRPSYFSRLWFALLGKDHPESHFDDMPVRRAQQRIALSLLKMIPESIAGLDDRTSPQSLRWLLRRANAEYLTFPIDKTGRWIGFVQGVLALSKYLNVDMERDRTRPILHDAYKRTGQIPPETKELEKQ